MSTINYVIDGELEHGFFQNVGNKIRYGGKSKEELKTEKANLVQQYSEIKRQIETYRSELNFYKPKFVAANNQLMIYNQASSNAKTKYDEAIAKANALKTEFYTKKSKADDKSSEVKDLRKKYQSSEKSLNKAMKSAEELKVKISAINEQINNAK